MFQFVFDHWPVLFIAAAVFIAWVFAKLMLGDEKMPYQKRASLLTSSELSFYRALNEAVGGQWSILPRVRMADLLQVAPETPKCQAWEGRVQSELVDFLLCDRETMEPKLAVELEHESGDKAAREGRVRFISQALADAGLPLLRIDVQSSYDPAALRKQVDDQFGATSR